MNFLTDSNILIRQLQHASPQHQIAVDAPGKLRLAAHRLCIVPQIPYEVWSVGTRPANVNGLGLSHSQMKTEITNLKSTYELLDETAQVFAEWENLVSTYAIMGKKAHDAHLVAAMIVHGITHLLTFNQADFQRFTGITAMAPAEVMALP